MTDKVEHLSGNDFDAKIAELTKESIPFQRSRPEDITSASLERIVVHNGDGSLTIYMRGG